MDAPWNPGNHVLDAQRCACLSAAQRARESIVTQITQTNRALDDLLDVTSMLNANEWTGTAAERCRQTLQSTSKIGGSLRGGLTGTAAVADREIPS